MKFTGYVKSGPGASHYTVNLNGHIIPLCQGIIYEQVSGIVIKDSTKRIHTYAWGYIGDDPAILAITLLYLALGGKWDGDFTDRSMFAMPTDLTSRCIDVIKMKAYCEDVPGLIKATYQAFTKEVISELPDTWDLTADEILQWLKKKDGKCS